ncbi:MAG: ion transporter [Campylobacteraceae bacterium]|jgi:voltage-gated sodium channel|nr:ion transporter [Campylobacteraceae bacterium]MBT3882880.1 ion transporter [Campylobacteraceae bacterium]MBT4030812.1 ion transporter [Campylobacteraceae bacterium]MBT4179104.1 ion transporter [Campylobacteraceae bacterium]MBT4572938.1 ion transporter [Campylobacteraceae bacterium]
MTLKEKLIITREAKWFSNLTTAIIIFYASMLGFKTLGDIEGNFSTFIYWLDNFITIYFLIEIIIKMSAEKNFMNFFKSGWNIFDFIIVAITLIPLDNSSVAAIARLLRIFRVLRLITSRPELKKIIDMLLGAIPSIIDIVILMFIIFYIYAIIGNFLFESVPSGLWKDFLVSMLTLFRILTFEDWTDVMYEGMEIYPWSWIYFVSFVIIAAFVFFNLFIAVIIGEMEKINNKDIEDEIHDDSKKIDLLLKEISQLRQEVGEIKNDSK